MELDHIRRHSLFLRWMVALGAVTITIFIGIVVLVPPLMEDIIVKNFGQISQSGVTIAKHLLLSGLVIVAVLPTLRALQLSWQLFGLYAGGEVLTESAAATLKSLGRMAILMSVVSIITPTLVVLILTYDNPPGAKQLMVQIGGMSYALALFGGLIMTVGWAMVEAARVDADNKAII